jgi:hypothetical protein
MVWHVLSMARRPGWVSTTGLDEGQDLVDMKAIIDWALVPYDKRANPLDWIASQPHICAKCRGLSLWTQSTRKRVRRRACASLRVRAPAV